MTTLKFVASSPVRVTAEIPVWGTVVWVEAFGGSEEALESGIKEIAIFASCSESFSKSNINCTIEESFERFVPVMKLAKKNKIKV